MVTDGFEDVATRSTGTITVLFGRTSSLVTRPWSLQITKLTPSRVQDRIHMHTHRQTDSLYHMQRYAMSRRAHTHAHPCNRRRQRQPLSATPSWTQACAIRSASECPPAHRALQHGGLLTCTTTLPNHCSSATLGGLPHHQLPQALAPPTRPPLHAKAGRGPTREAPTGATAQR